MYLLVEDTYDLGETVQDYLLLQGYTVHRVKTYAQAKLALSRHFSQIDCVIIDWMLPDGEGRELCRWIKEQRSIPCILTTAKSQIDDRLAGFAAGADDYLSKPYDLRELLARIHVISTRHKPIHYETKTGCMIDPQAMTIWIGKEHIDCSATERVAIKLFCAHRHAVVPRSTLIDAIRGGDAWDAENNLDVLISSLRKKLGKETIQTVKGVGYKMQ